MIMWKDNAKDDKDKWWLIINMVMIIKIVLWISIAEFDTDFGMKNRRNDRKKRDDSIRFRYVVKTVEKGDDNASKSVIIRILYQK